MIVKNLIIGGGFTGLFLGTILDDSLIVESSDNVGGLLQGFKSKSGEFTFDVGGHVYTSKDASVEGIMTISNANLFPERMAYFDFRKKVPYPVQYNADMLGIEITPSPADYYPTFSSLLRHEFGKEFYENVLRPFNRRVWCVDPSAMATDWVDGRVALMSEKSVKWGANSSFYYATGNSILDTLVRNIYPNNYIVGTSLFNINIEGKIAYLKPTDGQDGVIEVYYENLFDTSGFILNLLRENLPYNKVLTIGVGLNRQIEDHFHWWYNGTDNASPIHRITLLSRYHKDLAPSGTDSLLIEVPYMDSHNGDELIAESYERYENTKEVMSILKGAGFDLITEEDIEEVVTIMSKGYPIQIISHRAKVARAREKMLNHNVYLVGRWGAHGYYNLEHNMYDARFAKQASLGVSVNDYIWANHYYKEKRKDEHAVYP